MNDKRCELTAVIAMYAKLITMECSLNDFDSVKSQAQKILDNATTLLEILEKEKEETSE